MTRRALSDALWTIIERCCLGKSTDPGQTRRNSWLFVEAVLWVVGTAAQLRELPDEFGNPAKRWMVTDALMMTIWPRGQPQELLHPSSSRDIAMQCPAGQWIRATNMPANRSKG